MDIQNTIDWLSIKLTGIGIMLAAITWNKFVGILSVIALGSTIVYNLIRIYKELKRTKKI